VNLQESFLQLALLGANWVLWILIGLSVAAVTIVIERWLFFRGIDGKDTALIKPVHDKLSEGDVEAAMSDAKKASSPGARMVTAALESAKRGVASATAIIDGMRPSEKLRLERNLGFLGTVGSNAPFIGLFGTVLEILRVFNALGEQGVTTGDEAREIMTGISEALVATAIGLLVAIPAVIAYNAFQRKVKRTLAEAEGLIGMTIADLSVEKE
jgi:biopolymer transport protein ExbB